MLLEDLICIPIGYLVTSSVNYKKCNPDSTYIVTAN